ncbi:MAG: hypothetical protein O2867_07475 [Bacteroidetes bacterium]|jgi:transcription elongation GreA/GreB family factor|nr:hypothetical protein [Bacteroidota bacterium]
MKMEKQDIFRQVKIRIEESESKLRSAVLEAEASRDSESKSSAGDKHETSRAMAQIEIENLQVQLQRVLENKSILDKMRLDEDMIHGQLGALIVTDSGTYFLSIGLGPVEITGGSVVYAVSPQSPIGTMLMGKIKGDSVLLNGKKITLTEVV